MKKPKLDVINFSRIFDLFGESAAIETARDVAEGRIRESTLEQYLYTDESKAEYTQRLHDEYAE